MEALFAGMGALITAIVGFLTIRQMRASQKVAERELHTGPRVEVAVNGSRARDTVWAIPWPDGRRFIADLDVVVRNSGNATLYDVVVVIETPDSIYCSELARHGDKRAKLLKMKHAADKMPGGPYVQVVYTAKAIHPGLNMAFHDFVIFGTPTRLRSDVTATAQDGVDVTVSFTMVFGYSLKVSVAARDVPPVSYDMTLAAFDINDPIVQQVITPGSEPSAEEVGEFGQERTAHVLVVREPEHPASDVPPEAASIFMRARTSGAQAYPAKYVPQQGYVRLEV
jgi:hypothetical protein